MRIKEHIALRNFSLQNSNREIFLTCKCNAAVPYLAWRIFWAVYHLSWLAGNLVVTSLHNDTSAWKWLIYLSNWMYLLLTVQCVLEAVIVVGTWSWKPDFDQEYVGYKLQQKTRLFDMYYLTWILFQGLICALYLLCATWADTSDFSQHFYGLAFPNPFLVASNDMRGANLPWYIQILWLLYTVSMVGAVMVCAWYWTLIHKDKRLTAIRFNTHAVAAIYVILNMAVTRLPVRLLHFLYPVGFGVAYTLFSVIYYSLGGTNQNGETYIYSILDWSRPGRTLVVTSLSNFIFIPLVHVILWALSICFHKLNDRLRKPQVVYSQGLNNPDAEEVVIG